MKKILRTKLQYNCSKTQEFNYGLCDWYTKFDRSFDMYVSASTKEDCEKIMESFEDAIRAEGIQDCFESNIAPEYDEKKKLWVGAVEVYVGNDFVADEKEAIKEVYNDWKVQIKNAPAPTQDLETDEQKTTEPKKRNVKKIGGVVYIHQSNQESLNPDEEKLVMDCSSLLIQKDLVAFMLSNILKIDVKNKSVSFIECDDWNSAREPVVGDSHKITLADNGELRCTIDNREIVGTYKLTKKREKNPQIYHHKWMFVSDDYKGFDVEKEKAWSKKWQSVVPKGLSSSLGSKNNWEKFLNEYGLDIN